MVPAGRRRRLRRVPAMAGAEDVVYLLERSGIDTGIDLDALIAAARWLSEMLGHDLPGRALHAGPFRPGVS